MEKLIDLHTHSTFSDGTFTPEELVKAAKDVGLAAIALTDHDTVDGLSEAFAAGEKYGVEVVSGIEFSVDNTFPMHILGLDFDMPCKPIADVMNYLLEQRNKRLEKICERLFDMGMEITRGDLESVITGKVLGRSQLAQILVKKGYTKSIKEGFDKYLEFGRPAYVKREGLSDREVIDIINQSGGKAFAAHLNQTGKSLNELYEILKDLKDSGLSGIEGYYTEYTEDMNREYRKMAKDLGLLLSGGSDFHGTNKDNHNLGTGSGNLKIPYSLLEEIRN